jgi:hypothetical protein
VGTQAFGKIPYTWRLAGCLVERAGLASIMIPGRKTYTFTFPCICHIYLKTSSYIFLSIPFSDQNQTDSLLSSFYIISGFFSFLPFHHFF